MSFVFFPGFPLRTSASSALKRALDFFSPPGEPRYSGHLAPPSDKSRVITHALKAGSSPTYPNTAIFSVRQPQ